VQFWYEYRDVEEEVWKRCYGIEHWTFDAEGKMEKRMMSGNDVVLGEGERWFGVGVVDVDEVGIGEGHW
jgi:nuclear transport factor 2 (NTF2) superfamily protein